MDGERTGKIKDDEREFRGMRGNNRESVSVLDIPV